MPRRLSLVRHAEAANSAAGSLDRHRVLTDMGRDDARALGAFLAREGQAPAQVLCSDAVRALDTARLILEGADVDCSVVVLDELYAADPDRILMLIQENGNEEADKILVVGHNPSIGALAQTLADSSGQGTTFGGALGHFEPGSCATFAIRSLDWEGLHASHAEVRRVSGPADYR